MSVKWIVDTCKTCGGTGTIPNGQVWTYTCEEPYCNAGDLKFYDDGEDSGWFCQEHGMSPHCVEEAGVLGGEHPGEDPCPICTTEGELELPFPRGRGWVNPRLRVSIRFSDGSSRSFEDPHPEDLLHKVDHSGLPFEVGDALLLGLKVERAYRRSPKA